METAAASVRPYPKSKSKTHHEDKHRPNPHTHVGSLIRPQPLQEIMRAKQVGEAYDRAAYDACLKQSIADVVRRQAGTGLDVISDGEFGKAISWNQYVVERLSGFELRAIPAGYRPGTRAPTARFRGVLCRARRARP